MTTGSRITQGSPDYFGLVDQVTSMVTAVVPPSKTVLVVSKGDENLLQLGSRTGWHFPRTDDGRYAGHYPADSDDAVRQLELLRDRGASYLVFPATSMWWLDHYPDLSRHLESRYTSLVRDEDTCAIYDLTGGSSGSSEAGAAVAGRSSQFAGGAQTPAAGPAPGTRTAQLTAFLDHLLPEDATVVVATSSREGAEALRRKDVDFLVVPRETLLATDDTEFLAEVERRHRCIARQRYLCSVYELTHSAPARRENFTATEKRGAWRRLLRFFRRGGDSERG
jgi:hypothetical protein